MNEIIIIGMLLPVFGAFCIVCAIVDNFGKICKWLYDWLFDISTAYYKFKMQRRRRRMRL